MTPQMDNSNKYSFSQIMNYNNDFALKISHPCNGFNLFLLYLGFLFVYRILLLRMQYFQ